MELVVGTVFLIVGSAILWGAFLLLRRSVRRLQNWTTTTGTVIEYIDRAGTGRRACYLPKVQFSSPHGRSIKFTSESGSNRKPFRLGSKVKVIYDPADIQNASIKVFQTLWLVPCFALFFGGIFTSIGVNLVFFSKH